MKNVFIIVLLFLFMTVNNAQSLKIVTYNIRYDAQNDGENQWKFRKNFLANQLKFHSPHVFGIQEGLHHQVQFLDSALTEYKYIGVGRDDGYTEGEYSAIFYKFSELKVIMDSTFWLSETPDKISVGWDAAMERICTFSLFQRRNTGELFWVFNSHLDHKGDTARKNSIHLILDVITTVNSNEYPVVFMGDFNLDPKNETIKFLQQRMQDAAICCQQVCFGPSGTFNGFRFCEPVTRRIDYIFVSNEIVVQKYAVLSDSWDKKYPSDHFPVIVELDF